MISDQYLRDLVAKSSTIFERLELKTTEDQTNLEDSLVQSKIEKWVQFVFQGNYEKFERRLKWDRLNVNIIKSSLRTLSLDSQHPLPPWIKTLQEVLQAASRFSSSIIDITKSDSTWVCNELILFQEVAFPFLSVARQKLFEQVGSDLELITHNALISLERTLLKRLSKISSKCLDWELSVFRKVELTSLDHLITKLQGESEENQAQDFIKDLFRDGLASFFKKYPVLARLMTIVTELWVQSSTEFIKRLKSDLPKIQAFFEEGKDLGKVIEINSGLSDYHNEGRCVICLQFCSGLRLVYKPKDLGIDVSYFQLLSWLNQHGVPLEFKVLKVINCHDYGWMEYVNHSCCNNEKEVRHYYQRAGILLCLLYVLGGEDCHDENLIACGEHPVLIDLEALMHPKERQIEGLIDANFLVNKEIEESVLHTGLLPKWEFGQGGKAAYDISGLGGGVDSKEIQPNNPCLRNIKVSLADYTNDIVFGFEQMYRFLIENRNELLSISSPLKNLSNQKIRFIFRATQVYAALIHKTLYPQFLKDGIDWSIGLDVLSRALILESSLFNGGSNSLQKKHYYWNLLKAEKKSIQQLDIPYFSAYPNSDQLITSNMVLDERLKERSYEQVIEKIRRMNNEVLAKQIAMIQGSLYSSSIRDNSNNSHTSYQQLICQNEIFTLNQEQLVNQALIIAKDLECRAIFSEDESVAWIGLGYAVKAQRFQFQALSYDLYNGICGVALFLAALRKVTGSGHFHNLALKALKPLRQNLQKTDLLQRIVKFMGIGGGDGCGSIIYAFVQISKLLEETSLLKDAQKIASFLNAETIKKDQNLDILGGAAGTILGLLSLFDATHEGSALELATSCGEHLLSKRVISSDGNRTWADSNGRLLTGFSHGAAGITYSLLCLYGATKDLRFLEAAQEGISYENSVYSEKMKNWPDFRSQKESFANAWCNGSIGIGLARLGSLAFLNTNDILKDIEIAIEAAQTINLQGVDTLCCGNFGKVDLLLTAAHTLNRPQLLEKASQQVTQLISRAEQTGSFSLLTNLPQNVYSPGLFQGITGIGYELIRVAYPTLLPSVLLWGNNSRPVGK